MQFQILEKPEFSIVRVQFDAAGEQMLLEPNAMVARDSDVQMKTGMQGGLLAGLKRKLSGESVFQNTFTSSKAGETLWFAPAPEGDVEVVQCDGVTPVFLSSGAFLASSPAVTLDTKWGGAKGFFSGAGVFLLKAQGTGPLFFCAYGGIHRVDLAQYGGSYVVDTSHVVGWTGAVDYSVRGVGGLKSMLTSGEGLVCDFRGQGTVWLSTRNSASLAHFLEPFRPVKAKSSG